MPEINHNFGVTCSVLIFLLEAVNLIIQLQFPILDKEDMVYSNYKHCLENI